MAASMQKRQADADNGDDHSSESANEGPPEIVMSVLLLEPPSFSFITQPTKRCLRIVRDTIGRFCRLKALELGSPRGFHLWLSHRPLVVSREIPRFSPQPIANDASALLAIIRPGFREAIVRYLVALDTKRALDDLGGSTGVVGVDCSFENIGHGAYSSLMTRESAYLERDHEALPPAPQPALEAAASGAKAFEPKTRHASCFRRNKSDKTR
jgi:hypothetical protein